MDFCTCGALLAVGLPEFVDDVVHLFEFGVIVMPGFFKRSFLIDVEQCLLTGRIGAHVFYLHFWIHEFCEQCLDAQVYGLVLQISVVGFFAFGGGLLHVASYFHVYFVNAPHLLP